MTLNEISQSIAKYLTKSYDKFDVGGESSNLILTALNHARKHAERSHDFSICRQRGYLSVLTKTAWQTPTWYDGRTEKMRKGKNWTLKTSGSAASEFAGTFQPLRVVNADTMQQLQTKEDYDGGYFNPYPRDGQPSYVDPLLGQPYVVLRGQWLEYHPVRTETGTIVVDGYRWWPDWSLTGGEATYGEVNIPSTQFNVARAQDWYMDIAVSVSGASARRFVFVLDAAANGYGGPDVFGNTPVIFLDNVDNKFLASEIIERLTLYAVDATADGSGGVDIVADFPGSTKFATFTVVNAAGATVLTDTVYGTGTAGLQVTDWWTENASEYLMFQGMIEANYLYSTFTANREANLPPPVKQAERALETLIRNDSDSSESGQPSQFY